MPKEEWGVKRVCPTTGKRFYDLNQSPVLSPYTGEVVNIDTGKGSRSLTADKPDKSGAEPGQPVCAQYKNPWHPQHAAQRSEHLDRRRATDLGV